MMNSDYYYLLIMFWRYFQRKLFNNHFFCKTENKIMVLILTIMAYSISCYSIYSFLNNVSTISLEYLRIIILSYNNNLVLIAMIIFISFKFITLSSNKFLKYTYTLPVTMNVRNKSFLIFELIGCYVLLLIFGSVFMIPFSLVFGVNSFLELILPVMFNITTIVSVSNVLFYLFTSKLKIKQYVKYSCLFSLYFTAIILGYMYAQNTNNFLSASNVALNGFNYYLYFYYNYGAFVMILIYVCSVILASVLIYYVKIDAYVYYNEYYKVMKLRFSKYPALIYIQKGILRLIRNFTNLNFLITIFCISLIICFLQKVFAVQWLLLLMSLLGYEGYVKTYFERPLMQIHNVKRSYQLVEYIIAPLLIIVVFALWFLCLQLLFFEGGVSLKYYLICLCGLIVNTGLGILFPAYDNNPVSPILSLLFILVVSIILNFIITFLQISYFYHTLAIIIYSIVGISLCYFLLWYKDWWLK